MARPVYPYEMSDPDFAWLLETFLENRPGYVTIEDTCLPIVLLAEERKPEKIAAMPEEFIPDNPFEKLLLPEPDESEKAE